MSKSRRISSNPVRKFSTISSHSAKECTTRKLDKKHESSFALLLKKCCDEENIQVPIIKVSFTEPFYDNFNIFGDEPKEQLSAEKLSEKRYSRISTVTELESKKQERKIQEKYDLLALYDNYDYPNNLTAIVMKNYKFESQLVFIFQEVFNLYNTITTIRLEFCNLSSNDIQNLADLLQDFENISDLTVDGNPNELQNFHLLLKNTFLSSLSLKHCNIVDRTTKLLAGVLSDFESQTLVCLNLSSNNISDIGVENLSSMLRTNRNLVYLGLGDNYITDAGCKILMNVFQKFTLTHEEIVIRRHKNMAHLKKRTYMIEELRKKNKLPHVDLKIEPDILLNKKRSNTSISKKRNSKKGSADSSTQKSSKVSSKMHFTEKKQSAGKRKQSLDSMDNRKIRKSTSIELPTDHHPFILECYPEDKQVFCKGNFVITHLNLAYNKITREGVQAIRKMLEYQIQQDLNGNGIKRILIEGNMMLESCKEFSIIQELLQQKMYSVPSVELKNVLLEKRKRASFISKETTRSCSSRV